jgi:hypothetical protein
MRKLFGLVAAAAILLVLAVPASADNGANAVSLTQTINNQTIVFPVTPLCGLPGGMVTAQVNAVFHLTVLTSGVGAGTGWFTATETGFFTEAPTDTSLGTFSGHFAVWFGDNNNLSNGTMAANINVQAMNDVTGATVNVNFVEHFSVSATDDVTFFFACN